MGFTTAGLANGGRTPHYKISYDDTFSGNAGVALAAGLLAVCEKDFALMSSWFAGVHFEFSFPLPIQIVNASGGASWEDPPDVALPFGVSPTITINALNESSPSSVGFLRYLLVSEVTEMFMASLRNGWFEDTGAFAGADEGSKGEALSRFLGVQFAIASGLPPVPPPGFGLIKKWLNSLRPNFVDVALDDHEPDIVTACGTSFLYYLYNQLGFSINAIVAAGAPSLGGVYQKLTGKSDGWTAFIEAVNRHYPPGPEYHPAGDNIFPLSELRGLEPTNQIVCGYSDWTRVTLDRPAMAEIHIQLTSDYPSLVNVPSSVVIAAGGTSATVPLQTSALFGPFGKKSATISATYAGKTVTNVVEVVPPSIASVTVNPSAVICGQEAVVTVTLNRPALVGPLVAEVICGNVAFATVPALVTVPEKAPSATFVVKTPAIELPFKPTSASIVVVYGTSNASTSLGVKPKVIAGILNGLILLPATVDAGGSSSGMVTLLNAVPTPTVVSLSSFDTGGAAPAKPQNGSSLAIVPVSVTVPAGQTVGHFAIKTSHEVVPHTKRVATIRASAVVSKSAALTIDG